MVEAETRRSVSGRRPAAIKRAAAVGLVVAAVVCVCASLSTGGQGWGSVELEREPKEVRQLEREASHDVEKDATKAGLAALASRHNSLAETLTGGLKRKLKYMQLGDHALLHVIKKKSAASSVRHAKHRAVAAEAAKAEKTQQAEKVEKTDKAEEVDKAEKAAKKEERDEEREPRVHGKRGRVGGAKTKPSSLGAVEAAVDRDRVAEMHRMSKVLAKVAFLKTQVMSQEKKEHGKAVAKTHKQDVHEETAKALQTKGKQLKAKAESMERMARRTYVNNYKKLEKAETTQQEVIDEYKKEDAIVNGQAAAHVMQTKAKTLSENSIRELKQAGKLIKSSHMRQVGKSLPLHERVLADAANDKKKAKLRKASQNLTEKAVHEMLESRKMSKKAELIIRQAGKVSAHLPALENKARQAKLVMKVLEVQKRKAEEEAKSTPAFARKMLQGKKLLEESAKDAGLSKGLIQRAEKGLEAADVRNAAATEASIIHSDEDTATTLAKLRLQLDREKRFVESDDAVISALGN